MINCIDVIQEFICRLRSSQGKDMILMIIEATRKITVLLEILKLAINSE